MINNKRNTIGKNRTAQFRIMLSKNNCPVINKPAIQKIKTANTAKIPPTNPIIKSRNLLFCFVFFFAMFFALTSLRILGKFYFFS